LLAARLEAQLPLLLLLPPPSPIDMQSPLCRVDTKLHQTAAQLRM